jgi:Flp pilus assembly protein TadG
MFRRTERERHERGAAAVEFALVVPLLLLILLGLVDLGRLFFVQVSLAGSSREGARAVSVGRSSSDVDAIVQASSPGVARVSTLDEASSLAVAQVRCTSTGTPNAAVTVSVPFRWFTPVDLIAVVNPQSEGRPNLVITSRSEMLCLG